MDANVPILVSIYLIVLVLGSHIGLALMFRKAGQAPWKAFVPGLNYYVWVKLLDKGLGWFIAMLIPILNVVVWLILAADSTPRFKRHGFWDGVLAMAFPWAYFPFLGLSDKTEYISMEQAYAKPKPAGREWADAAAFAIIAAVTVRTFIFEAYTIPTTSMEGTLLAGDFLFVSKFHYGPRIPQTPLSIPFMHQTIPRTKLKPYLDKPQLPYRRLPGLQRVKRNDVVVFNWPEGDSIFKPYGSKISYYDLQRRYGTNFHSDPAFIGRLNQSPSLPFAQPGSLKPGPQNVATFPVDKRDNYIKRCVGLPGDKLEVRGGELMINDQLALKPRFQQYRYNIVLKPDQYLGMRYLEKELHLNTTAGETQTQQMIKDRDGNVLVAQGLSVVADTVQIEALRQHPSVLRVQRNGAGAETTATFPHVDAHPGNVDDFGPVNIPAKGATVELTADNLPFYQRIVQVFEHGPYSGNGYAELERRVASGERVPYTFEMDYYFMMGDNRHQSQDSRYWGFVPEDHVMGKAWFVFWSWKVQVPLFEKIGSLRLNRLLMPVRHGK